MYSIIYYVLFQIRFLFRQIQFNVIVLADSTVANFKAKTIKLICTQV